MYLSRNTLTAHHAKTIKQNASQFLVDIKDSLWHLGLYTYYFDVVLSVTVCQITQDSIKLFLGSFLTSHSPATFEGPRVLSGMQTQLSLLLVSKLISPRKAQETIYFLAVYLHAHKLILSTW